MKIAIYYNHSNTLGHSMYVLALLKSLRRDIPGVKVLVLEGARSPADLALHRYARVVRLPRFLAQEGQPIAGRGVLSERTIRGMFIERQAVMRSALKRFDPDIFITEHFPFGQDFGKFELTSLLSYVKREIKCGIVGCIGYLNYSSHTYMNVEAFYDHLFIHSPRKIALTYLGHLNSRSAAELKRVLEVFRKKIHFPGFCFDPPTVSRSDQRRDRTLLKGFERLIFVSRGGGAWSERILLAAIMSARRKKSWRFVICCGPATSARDMKIYQRLASGAKNVVLAHSLTPRIFDRYVAAADLCVNLCGYYTLLKLMYYRKRAVLIPYRMSEQRWRARLLLDYIPAVLLREEGLNADRLCAAMDQALEKPCSRRKIRPGWFDGAARTAWMLTHIASSFKRIDRVL